MSADLLQIGKAQAHYNVANTRELKYSVEMYHKGLNEHKIISTPDLQMLENKANLQVQKWGEKWELISRKRKNLNEREANLDEANERTEKAQESLKEIENLLLHTLTIDDAVNWNSLKDNRNFPESAPSQPTRGEYKEYPIKPNKNSPEFKPVFSFWEKLITSKKQKKIRDFEEMYIEAIEEWEKDKSIIDSYNKQVDKNYDIAIEVWRKELSEWEKRKEAFLQEQITYNKKIDELMNSYAELNVDSIIEYCEMVLNNSEYPDSFSKNFELEYSPESKILIVEYELPSQDCFPRLKEVKYISSRKELKEYFISESQLDSIYDKAIYKITLRTIHELLEADSVKAIEAISFNGWVKAINKSTGKEENNCILSIQVKKGEFLQIDLSNVDPKTCFKTLKGVASSRLSSLTPVQPILQISRVDKRFVESYEVANKLDSSNNIAAMDWEDFEHLIRELFEKEFKSNGGEVKVTQASRDGGVDAIAFDPDPIRGGKIVIQAKRYTNTVGVSAVRDLYGTILNEGATKGILVSTADYGPDAYDFAKGKPITLLNGSNLLHLLEKHGHHAKIDLREAKKILSEKDR